MAKPHPADEAESRQGAQLKDRGSADDIAGEAVGHPAAWRGSLAWRVRVTASSDPLFYASPSCSVAGQRFLSKSPSALYKVAGRTRVQPATG